MAGRSLEKVQKAMSEVQAASPKGTLSAVQLEVTDEESIKHAAAYVEKDFGKLDVLVNNAGVGDRNPDIKKRLQACLDTNVIGPAVVSSHFRPLLLKSQKPYSIYVSSGVGSLGLASDPTSQTYRSLARGEAYRASKAALNMIALQESIEMEETALKVFAMCPGFVRSNLRGTDPDAVSGWGAAEDPIVSGKLILSIIEGERDADARKFVHNNDGVFPW